MSEISYDPTLYHKTTSHANQRGDVQPPRIRAIFFTLTLMLALLPACGYGNGSGINVSGSTSVSPFAEHLAELYQQQHPGTAINVQSLGSSAGIQAAIEGVAEIGMSSRELKPEEADKLHQLVIARDALAVIVHPSNLVGDLSLSQVQDIFSGKIKNWTEVGGPARAIVPVAREAGSGTFAAFEELVMEGIPITTRALRQGSNGAIRQVVAEDPNAIGYISIGIVDNTVKMVDVDGIKPSVENVKDGVYKFARNFLFVWPKGKALPPLAQGYMDYVMSDASQAELERLGLVRVK